VILVQVVLSQIQIAFKAVQIFIVFKSLAFLNQLSNNVYLEGFTIYLIPCK